MNFTSSQCVTSSAVSDTRKGALAKSLLKPKAKLKYAASPLCFGHYYYSGKGGKQTLVGCDMYDSFYDISLDPEKFYTGAVILEILDKMGMENDYNNDLFVLAIKGIKDIAYTDVDPKAYLFGHISKLMEALGYECKAITLLDYYNYFHFTHSVNINSLKELINL